MPAIEIADQARITLRFRQLNTNEEHQWSFATGHRGEFSRGVLMDAIAQWFADDGIALVEQSTLIGVTYSEWGTSGFIGWHQLQQKITSTSSGTGAVLPPQCAWVVSLLNEDVPTDSIKRRRGRIYLGLIPTSLVGTDGKMTTAAQTLGLAQMHTLQVALATEDASDPTYTGLCIASPTGGKLYTAEVIGVGRGVDTQRRRREKVVEDIIYEAL